MGLFDGLDTPKWMTIQDMGGVASRDTAQIGHNFAQALGQKRAEDFQRQQVQDQRNFALKQQQIAINALGPIAQSINENPDKTPAGNIGFLSQHPEWFLNPIAGPFVTKFAQTQGQMAKIQNAGTAAKISLQNNTEFLKGMSGVDPEDAAAIQGMKPNPDGSPSAMQWQTLRTAQETARVAKENSARMAQITALASGEVPESTTINAKGDVVQKFKTPNPTTTNQPVGDWVPKTVNIGGREIHFLQGPKGGMKMINDKGESVEPSNAELTRLSTSVDVDKELKQLATEKLKQSFIKKSPVAASTAVAPKNEVTRVTPDGKKAIFDSQTKKFLRYAN